MTACPPVVLSHPFGNPNSYEAATAFQNAGSLYRFLTCIYSTVGPIPRNHPALKPRFVEQHCSRELLRLGLAYSRIFRDYARSTLAIDLVANDFDRWAADRLTREIAAVWLYEDFALYTARRAQKLGTRIIYDLPTVYYPHAVTLANTACARCPEVSPFLESISEPSRRIARKLEEISLADEIVCASSFVRNSLVSQGMSDKTIRIIPYGTDCSAGPRLWTELDQEGPLKILFVGKLNAHKGLHNLFAALARVRANDFQLTLAGSWKPGFRNWLQRRYPVRFSYVGQIAHDRISDLYRKNHLFIFPSLQDGFGLVILEAMAAGLPVIASTHSGAPDLITPGINGFLFEAGDVDALESNVRYALGNRERLPFIGAAARMTAEQFSWAAYRANVVEAITREGAP
jgi:starch synthase